MPIVMPPRSASTGRRRVRVQAIARVFRWRGIPGSEAFATIIEEVAAERTNSNHASRMLRRTLLAPQTVEANDGTSSFLRLQYTNQIKLILQPNGKEISK